MPWKEVQIWFLNPSSFRLDQLQSFKISSHKIMWSWHNHSTNEKQAYNHALPIRSQDRSYQLNVLMLTYEWAYAHWRSSLLIEGLLHTFNICWRTDGLTDWRTDRRTDKCDTKPSFDGNKPIWETRFANIFLHFWHLINCMLQLLVWGFI